MTRLTVGGNGAGDDFDESKRWQPLSSSVMQMAMKARNRKGSLPF
jgi:hypothetical protein